jgi:para-aminobenzoate synthetase component 1
MIWHNKENGFEQINTLAKQRTPFLFITSFDGEKIFAQPLDDLDDDIFYKLEDWRNYPVKKRTEAFTFSKSPIDFNTYKKALNEVLEEIRSGNTYLLNLTFRTPIESSLTLKEIFTYARAKFKLYFKRDRKQYHSYIPYEGNHRCPPASCQRDDLV